MKTEIKQQWIDALRSGEYEQGQERLRKISSTGQESFCCLGVLCDLAVKAGVEVEVSTDTTNGWVRYDGATTHLPFAVQDWAGLRPGSSPTVGSGTPLVNINDGGASFEDIADLIDKDL